MYVLAQSETVLSQPINVGIVEPRSDFEKPDFTGFSFQK